MANLSDLIARLQAATKGSRDLDAELAVALGWQKRDFTAPNWDGRTQRYCAWFPPDWEDQDITEWIDESAEAAKYTGYYDPANKPPPEFTTGPEGLGLAVDHALAVRPERDLMLIFLPKGKLCVEFVLSNLGSVEHSVPAIAAWIAVLDAMKEGE